jgi:hypothetical protein
MPAEAIKPPLRPEAIVGCRGANDALDLQAIAKHALSRATLRRWPRRCSALAMARIFHCVAIWPLLPCLESSKSYRSVAKGHPPWQFGIASPFTGLIALILV